MTATAIDVASITAAPLLYHRPGALARYWRLHTLLTQPTILAH